MKHWRVSIPTRQDVHGRWADALLWARMKVDRTFLFVAEKTLHRRRVRFGRTNNDLRTPGRIRTSGKLSYGPKEGHFHDVTSECDVLWTTLALLTAFCLQRFSGFPGFQTTNDVFIHGTLFHHLKLQISSFHDQKNHI